MVTAPNNDPAMLRFQIQQALEFESILEQINDLVRDSLQESHILQTAVEVLAAGLDLNSCDIGIYSLDQQQSRICHESVRRGVHPAVGTVFQMSAYPDIYHQLRQGKTCQISWLREGCDQRKIERMPILVCPIKTDQGVIGDMWLYKPFGSEFSDAEIRLVRQVATQCGIGIRQARLYQADQAQVQELERLNRLKDDFLSTVSHELRTPLTTLQMALHMMQQTNNEQKRQQYYEMALSHCQQEINLINDFLDLQRLKSGVYAMPTETLLLEPWLSAILESLQTQTTRHQIDIHIPSDPIPLRTIPYALERILTELVTNACKHTPPGGQIEFLVMSTPTGLLFTICNSVSIPEVEIPRLFDKFYRIQNADPWRNGGTGLGLTLVKALTDHLQGEIEVTSQEEWTTFTLRIPNFLAQLASDPTAS